MRFALQPSGKYKWVESVKGEITKQKPGVQVFSVSTIPVSMDQIERSFRTDQIVVLAMMHFSLTFPDLRKVFRRGSQLS